VRLLSADDRDDVCYMLDHAFESALKLYGKDKAFPFAVQAQKLLGGWSDFYERSDRSEDRLARVAEIYPDRAEEFIAKSCFAWLRHKRQPSTRVIPGEKLVFFLVKLGRLSEANALVTAMVNALLEDTRRLRLTTPRWVTVT
jgi:hypothetical protein